MTTCSTLNVETTLNGRRKKRSPENKELLEEEDEEEIKSVIDDRPFADQSLLQQEEVKEPIIQATKVRQ